MIVIPSLNTARDVIALAPAWRQGGVQRADRVLLAPGGKPLNVARFLGTAGVACRLVAAADRWLADQVSSILGPSVELDLVVTARPSRTDVHIVDERGILTVVNGPPGELSPRELEAVLSRVEAVVGEADLLLVAGSQPPMAASSLATVASRRGARLAVDSSGADLEAALAATPLLAKVNADELAELRGGDPEEAWRDGRSLAAQPEILVVSRGERGARAWLPAGEGLEVRPPVVETVNPLGAGDALMAALLAAIDAGRSVRDGLLEGTAWAAAVASTMGLQLDLGLAERLRAGVRVEPLERPIARELAPRGAGSRARSRSLGRPRRIQDR